MSETGIVPAQLKIDNGYFYNKSIEDHPYTKINNTRLLIISLKSTMKLAEIHDHDSILKEAELLSKRAWYELKGLNNEGRAVQTAHEALDRVMFLLYDKRFANPESVSFTGRGDK